MSDGGTDAGSDVGADAPMVLFTERGASWWPVAIGPLLGLAGALAEAPAPGGPAWPLWITLAVVVGGVTALIVVARRRFLRVTLTPAALELGTTALAVDEIAAVRPADGSDGFGVKVLGDHPVVPRRTTAVVLRLHDGAYRAAWARDADGLRRALRLLVPTDPGDRRKDTDTQRLRRHIADTGDGGAA